MITIYVIKCENDKYFVIETKNNDITLDEILISKNREWLNKYKPLNIVEKIENCDEMDEDKYTKIYMKKYGIDNVRGGIYCLITLPYYQIKTLNDELSNANNLCFHCHEKGHFVKNCPQKKMYSKQICSRCNLIGHTNLQCYAKKLSDGSSLINRQVCIRCNRTGHTNEQCYAKTFSDGRSIINRQICTRCHRIGHTNEQCYAKTFSDGRSINISHTNEQNKNECVIL